MAQGILNGSRYDSTNVSDSALLIERTMVEYTVPSGITSVGPSAFNFCSKLEKLYIPEGVQGIGSTAISKTSIKSLTLPLSCCRLTSYSLSGNSKLEEIKFGYIETIQSYALSENVACLRFDFSKSKIVPTLNNTNAFNSINANAKIIVPASLYDDWIVATNWSAYADHIEAYYIVSEGLEINGAAVVGRGSCTDSVIVIPDGITEIGEGAFVNDQGIDTLVLPKGGASIVDGSLEGSSLKKIVNCNGSVYSFALYGLSIERISFVDSQWRFVPLGFSGIQGSPIYDFSKCTSVMYLDACDLEFVSVGENTKFIVPASLYDDWVSDTNWAYFADYIVAAE